MKMQQILCFKEIVKTKNFTTAANNLFLSQPSVSYNIRELEKELGVSLLTRSFSSTQVTITEFGESFIKYVDRILSIVEECECVFADVKRYKKNFLNFGCAERVCYDVMPELVKYAAYNMPNLETVLLNIRTSRDYASVENEVRLGEIDFGMFHQMPPDDFEYVKINQDELVALVPDSHPAANKDTVKLSDLADLHIAMPTGSSQICSCINSMFADEGIQPSYSNYGGKLFEDRLLGVSVGECYTITSNFPVKYHNMTAVRIDSPHNKRDLYIMWKKGRILSENEEYLIDFCRNYKG